MNTVSITAAETNTDNAVETSSNTLVDQLHAALAAIEIAKAAAKSARDNYVALLPIMDAAAFAEACEAHVETGDEIEGLNDTFRLSDSQREQWAAAKAKRREKLANPEAKRKAIEHISEKDQTLVGYNIRASKKGITTNLRFFKGTNGKDIRAKAEAIAAKIGK